MIIILPKFVKYARIGLNVPHSTPRFTPRAVYKILVRSANVFLLAKVYTNVDPVLRQSVNQLPVAQWLQK